jgi:DsbC/DsbD-like thiol-disulfide interchange protein
MLGHTIGLALLALGLGDSGPPPVNIALDPPTDRHPVVAGAALVPGKVNPGGTVTLIVKSRIAPMWHIYAADAPTGGSIATTLKLKLPDGVSTKGEWNYPTPIKNPDAEGWIYQGDLTFSRTLKLSPDLAPRAIEIACEFGYQACDAFSCRPPTTIDLKLKAQILPPR